MREHGTHSCYVHGPNPGTVKGGCRCEPCRLANRAYENARAKRIAPPYVNASTARAHVRDLIAHGVGLKTIAKRAGISHGAASKLIYGDPRRGTPPSKRIRPETHDRLLAVKRTDHADGGRLDAAPILAIVDRLVAVGWSKTAIAHAIGQKGPGLQLGTEYVTARHARAIRALVDQPVPPRRTRWGLAAVTDDELEPPQIDTTAHSEIDRYELPALPTGLGEWIRRGQCRRANAPTWMFFPGLGDNETLDAAKAVCATCSVQDECLEYALANDEPGVWGGTSGAERDRIAGRRLGATA